jgi:hypothetical protein
MLAGRWDFVLQQAYFSAWGAQAVLMKEFFH